MQTNIMSTPVTVRSGSSALQTQIRDRLPAPLPTNFDESDQPPGSAKKGSGIKFILYLTAFLAVVALCFFFIATYFGDGLSRAGHSADETPLEIVMANNVMMIPANTIRFPTQRSSGVLDRLDLYLHWPSLSGYRDNLKTTFSDASGESDLIFITFQPRTMSYDMSGRLEPIYSLFFKDVGVRTDAGLIRQPLNEKGGFIDEDMYFQPDSPYPFAARCVKEASKIGAPFCIRDVHVGENLMVTYRFHKKLLNQWQELDQAVRSYAKSMITNQSR